MGLALGLGLGLGLGSGLGVRVRARGLTSLGICSSWSSMAPSKRAQKSCGCSAAVALSEARQTPHV